MDISKKLKQTRENKGLSLSELSNLTGIAKSTLQRYETGYTKKIPLEAIPTIEKALNLPTGYLMGWSNDSKSYSDNLPSPEITDDYTEFPVIGEVAAGYDKIAIEDWEGDKIKIPNEYLTGYGKDEYFVLRVKGDSMYPQYQDGDKVLVLKQSTMNYSGEIGVVMYGSENATLKKIEYVQGEDWMRLVPINPNVPIITIEDTELEECRVLGIPRLLIREIQNLAASAYSRKNTKSNVHGVHIENNTNGIAAYGGGVKDDDDTVHHT